VIWQGAALSHPSIRSKIHETEGHLGRLFVRRGPL